MGIRRTAGRLVVATLAATALVTVGGAAQAMPVSSRNVASATDSTNSGQVGSFGRLGPLTDLVIQRLLVSDEVAASKFGTGKPIDDPVREQQELAAARQSAISLGIDPDATVRFFQQQISASKVVQRGLFDRWTAHPELAPTTRPDLNQIRAELDQLTTRLLQQLVAVRDLLSSGVECDVRLAVAELSGEIVDHLDGLHRHALTVALASVCTR